MLLRGVAALILLASSARATCTEADVKRMSHCMFSLQEPALTANMHEQCQYGESYFRCFSGACCADPEFADQVRFIQRDIKSWGCEGVFCGAAPAPRALSAAGFALVLLVAAGLAL
jgi:hypothetical protein